MRFTEYLRYFIGFIESIVLVSAVLNQEYSILLLLLTIILVSGKIVADLIDMYQARGR
ncbi:hypothetical protein HYX14_06740 [Candidatus Woesearchaeota archaeon]|nr:hypothetical protein [Candidatus Woesearchaeota archaeon]